MLKAIFILIAASTFTALSGCAGHKELRAPCARDDSTMSPLFSSVAYASDVSCGPMVRQDGVSVF